MRLVFLWDVRQFHPPGIESTFGENGDAIATIWVVNPFSNLFAVFTPTGLVVTAFCFLMFCLLTKGAISGFPATSTPVISVASILSRTAPTHIRFMDKKDREKILLTGPISQLEGTVLGKLKDDPDDDDKYAEYVTLKPDCGLTEHIMAYGATGSGKTRGLVKPFILQAMHRKKAWFW